MNQRKERRPLAASSRPERRAQLKPPTQDFPCLSLGAGALSAEAWREIRCGLKLSERETQIVRGIFDDSPEAAIAADLGISVHTVRTHVGRLRRKLQAVDRVKMIMCVLEEFLRLVSSAETKLPPICRHRAAGRCPLDSNDG